MNYVVENGKGQVLTARRATGKRMYQSRAGWSDNGEDAKIFNTKGAATNSAKQTGETDFTVYNAFITVGEPA